MAILEMQHFWFYTLLKCIFNYNPIHTFGINLQNINFFYSMLFHNALYSKSRNSYSFYFTRRESMTYYVIFTYPRKMCRYFLSALVYNIEIYETIF